MYEPARKTELFIVMTMYNEDEELFTRTMQGVIRNVAHLCTRERSKTWGKEGWKKVVVCIVSDGRQKINSRTLSVIASMGCYQDGVGKVGRGSEYFEQALICDSAIVECREWQACHGAYLRVHHPKLVHALMSNLVAHPFLTLQSRSPPHSRSTRGKMSARSKSSSA
jgi:Chitin synthase